jgi:hypothetical protein
MPSTPSFVHPRPIPTGEELEAIYARLMAYPNVIGCFLGRKRTNGADRRAYSVVVCVTEKVPRAELSPQERLPAWVTWSPNSREVRRCRTDVALVKKSGLHAGPLAGPGDLVGRPGSSASSFDAGGTVGAVLRHPTLGVTFTTAAHVLRPAFGTQLTFPPQAGPRISLRNGPAQSTGAAFEGQLAEIAWTANSDYALIKPVGVEARNAFQDSFPLVSTHSPDFFHIGTPLAALTASGTKALTYTGAKGVLPIDQFQYRSVHLAEIGPVLMSGGDSGCVVIDRFGRVWGFHLGFVEFNDRLCSVFRAASQDPGLRSSTLL